MTMDAEITIEAGFIHVVLSEVVYSPSAPKIFPRAAAAARDAGVSKILYDARAARGQLSTMDRFEHACRIAEEARGVQVAFVVDQSFGDPSLFGENVAVNRGGHIREFTTLTAAYEWLEVQPAN